jgi:hypothetical protein
MWVGNNDGTQESPFMIKVESTPRFSDGKVAKFSGVSRGKNKYAGQGFTMYYAVYQVNQGKNKFHQFTSPSVTEMYYVITSKNWESSFDGEMDIDFADAVGNTANSVTISPDSKNVFFGYTLLSKDKKFQKKDMRRSIRFMLRAFSHVDVPGSSDDNASVKISKRGANEVEWWNWW